MAGGNIIDAVKIQDEDANIVKVDATGSAYTIPVEHGVIHQGLAFTLVHNTVVAANSTYDILFQTPATEIHLMAHKIVTTTAPGQLCLFESPTVSASGTPLTSMNNLRSSAVTPNTVICKEPDITTEGTQVDCDFITGSKLEGGMTSELAFEWILKSNEYYLFRYQNASGIPTDANFSFFYMEI